MSSRTRTKQSIELEKVLGRAGEERSEPGGRAELLAGGAPLAEDALAGRAGRGLSPELATEAVDEARLRRAVGELDEDSRGRLVDALLEQLQDEREPLSEELRERLLDGMIDELLAGRRGERRSSAGTGCSAS